MITDLVEGVDFYVNEQGYRVFTESYLLKRNFCCGNGCKHCPYSCNKKLEINAIKKQKTA